MAASKGPIPPEDVYICWVQRSLARSGWPIAANGTDSPAYRAVVSTFQSDNGLPAHGTVDATTQNGLIKLNHVDSHYTSWVQDALIKARRLDAGAKRAESIMDRASGPTRRAVQRLQHDRGLNPDGWIGVKTERELRGLIGTAPPGADGRPAPCRIVVPKPPPEPVTDEQVRHKLRQALDWMNEYAVLHAEEICLARKLLTQGVDDGYVDATRMKRFFGDNRALHPHYFSRAWATVKRRMRSVRERGRAVGTADIVDVLKTIRQDLLDGMKQAYYLLTGTEVYSRSHKLEIKRELGARSMLAGSLYHCKFARDRYRESIGSLR
jgi:peptidoglycan hydrolase-like protein with peptidoglycan-binding domain